MKKVLIGILVFFVLGFVMILMFILKFNANKEDFIVRESNFIEEFEIRENVNNYVDRNVELKLVGMQKYLINPNIQPNIEDVDYSLFGAEYYAVLDYKQENIFYDGFFSSFAADNNEDYGTRDIEMAFGVKKAIPYKYKFTRGVDKDIFEKVLDVEYGQYLEMDNIEVKYYIKNVKKIFIAKPLVQCIKYEYSVYEKDRFGEDDYIGSITYIVPKYFVVYEYAY